MRCKSGERVRYVGINGKITNDRRRQASAPLSNCKLYRETERKNKHIFRILISFLIWRFSVPKLPQIIAHASRGMNEKWKSFVVWLTRCVRSSLCYENWKSSAC